MRSSGAKPTTSRLGAIASPSVEASILALTRELSVEFAPTVDVIAVVLGDLDRELERLLHDAVRREVERRGDDIEAVAATVIALQQSPRNSRSGEIIVLSGQRRDQTES